MKEETKVKTKEFMDKAKKLFDRGLNASKKALGVAGDAVQDFSDKSVLTLEMKQLEGKVKKQMTMLGELACKTLSKKGASLTAADPEVSKIMKEISRLNKEIKIRADQLGGETKKPAAKKTAAKKTEVKAAAKKPAVAKKSAAKKTEKK